MDNCLNIEARKKCLKILEYAPRTEAVLRQKLKAAGFDEESVEDAVLYAKSFGYVDDACYAQEYIRCGITRKSIRRLSLELKEKGVEPELIEKAAEQFKDDEKETIFHVARKRAAARPLTDEESAYKLVSYLVSKGFPYHDAREAAWTLWDEKE